ncbi:MAG: DUF3299 domain-containing protein [Bacteroidota bacterium]
MKAFFSLTLILCSFLVQSQVAGWEIFADTKSKWQWVEELGAEVQIPTFDKKVKELEGKVVTLTGHYLPLQLQGDRIIISKLPYASCFFCGGGVGQESVAEVVFNSVQTPFRADQLITVKGRLRLNRDDFEHLSFILEDAKVILL